MGLISDTKEYNPPCLFGIIIWVSLLGSGPTYGQVDTMYVCNPLDSAQLTAPANQYAYRWFPDTDLDNPTIANPVARPAQNTLYIAEMITGLNSDNLIVNPEFEEDTTGFYSDYTYVGTINTQGVYSVNESAANLNPVYFEDCPDHTDGMGAMLIVDGSPTANEKVWCQSIQVNSKTDYAFSAWLTSVNPRNPAALQFFINSAPLGSVFRAGNRVCDWRQFYEFWNSGDSQVAEICIVNQNTNPQGNDFAMDDFGFYELMELRYDSTLVLIESIEAVKEEKIFHANIFSPNNDGRNDLFLLSAGKGITQIASFRIYNRWGNLLFDRSNCEPNDPNCGWDGTFQGQPVSSDSYVFTATILYADQSVQAIRGGILLVR